MKFNKRILPIGLILKLILFVFFSAQTDILFTAKGITTETTNPKDQVSISANGWTLIASGKEGLQSISYKTLGIIMKDIHLSLQGENELHHFGSFFVQKKDSNQLSVRTTNPQTEWMFILRLNTLEISCTSLKGILIGNAPASSNRIIARLLDPKGEPINWMGTTEWEINSRALSFLPHKNADCMYFDLGQVSGQNFHCLFDRKTDVAISFTDNTLMHRNDQDQDILDIILPVEGTTSISLIPEYYTKSLGLPFYASFDETYFKKAPMIWSSWTSYYADVTEEDIVRNTDWLSNNLKPYGFEYVQLDDGYDRGIGGEHYWIDKWDLKKFSHGPKWLANYIKSKGLCPGLWVVPNAYAGAMEQHPEWYLWDKQGNAILDYSTPALDPSNLEVLNFLKSMFNTLNNWGFEYYKIDGECALTKYVPSVDKERIYNKSTDPVAVYRNRSNLIRETIGPKCFIEACPGGTPLDGIGFFNSYFTWWDLYNNWQGMYNLFVSINGNAFLNHIAVYVMPGEGLELGLPMSIEEAKKLRPMEFNRHSKLWKGVGTTDAEARTLVTYVALTGVSYPLASVMTELPEERIKLLKMTMPTVPILPVDLFSRGSDVKWPNTPEYINHYFPEILDLKVNAKSGSYDVVGLTNWGNDTTMKNINLVDKLGLKTDSSYVVFDFWNHNLLDTFRNQIKVDILPHDTRVLLIHPLLFRPQLVGISRHITGAYSIQNLSWDGSGKSLHGSSETVLGDKYTLFVYVPTGITVSGIPASTKSNQKLLVQYQLRENSLIVSFHGQLDPVEWGIDFADAIGK